LAGAGIGLVLAHHPKLDSFKLLNIAGLCYDFLGLVVLSEIVITSARWKNFTIRWVAGPILWGQTVAPIGAAIGAWSSGAASSAIVTSFFLKFWACSILPLCFLDAKVFYPRELADRDIESRVKRLGFGLLVAGVLVQLLAGFLDLYS
jgi:zinc transporter ZupT